MNILFLTQRVPYPENKGEVIRVFNQLKYLSTLGHKVTVACPLEQPEDLSNLEQLKKKLFINTLSCQLSAKFIRYIKGLFTNQAMSVCYFYNTKLQQQLNLLLIKQDTDLIICSSSSVMEYIFKAQPILTSLLQNRPSVIVDFMDLDSNKWQQYADRSGWLKKYIYTREAKLLKKYEKKVYGFSDHCLFTSTTEVDLFTKEIGSKDRLLAVGNGIDTNFFTPFKYKSQIISPVFIFTGVMDYLPNEDGVVWFVENIWTDILSIWPEAKFIIAGMRPTKKIKSFSAIKGIEVTGFVKDIRGYYQDANIFIAPLRIARGVQNKILQGFACKIPTISTPNAIQGIDCTPEEHILQAETEEQFVAQITRLMDSSELREKISNNALELVRTKYSWEGQLQKLDKLIKSDLT